MVKRVVDPDGDVGSDPIEQTFYLWELGQVVLQFDKTGSGNVTASNLSHRYLWGPAVDMLLADERVEDLFNPVDNETLWALTDHLGTVRDVVDDNSTLRLHREFDSYGNVLDAFHYDAAGDPVSESHVEAVTVAFAYTGKLFEVYTGLQYNWHRWYDPAVGQWMSEDPIREGSNWNAYVGNSPTLYVDPTGLARWFGEEWYWPWDERAGGFGDTMGAYGRAAGRAVTGTAAGAGAGAITGAGTGAAVGAGAGLCAGGVGAGPGALAGAGAGAFGGGLWGGLSGLVSAAWAEDALDAAKKGGFSGAIGGAFGGGGRAWGVVRGLTVDVYVGTGGPAGFGQLIGWGVGAEQATQRAAAITLSECQAARITLPVAKYWKDFYAGAVASGKGGATASERLKLMERVIELLESAPK